MAKGKLIVIEGMDGSGKATQTQLLLEKLGEKAEKVSFPDYKSDSSALVKMYLNGELGEDPNMINPYVASAFYAVDRVASYLKDWGKIYSSGKIILADRYTTSNAIYQLSKVEESEKPAFLNWMNDFEYNKMGLPKPDLVIYLDVDIDVSQKLMTQRYSGDESRKDIHEKNLSFLTQCRNSAYISAKELGWKIVPCCENGKIRSIEEIHNDIMKIAEENINLC